MKVDNLKSNIYNIYLKNFRSGQPWKPRKDFSDISDEINILLEKLSLFFRKFSHINKQDFFDAPLTLYPEERYPSLSFFTQRKAIKCYKLAQLMKEDQSPEKQFDSIKRGLIFISEFCLKNNFCIDDYLNIKNNHMPVWIEHYKCGHINPYNLFLFNSIFIDNIEKEDLNIWLPGFAERYNLFKTRYHNCHTTKRKSLEAFKKIKDFTNQEKLKKT